MKNFVLFVILIILNTSYLFSQENKNEIGWMDIQLSNYTYPHPVSTIRFWVGNEQVKMAYMDVKPPNYNGKNVLLLHGKNFNGAYWKTTIDTLTAEGYRVIVPDQIGFGKSSKPTSYQYTFHQLAYNTKALLDKLNIASTTVLGHSMGGMIATRFALMYPERTDKLVLENPIGLEDWQLKVPYQPVNWWYEVELKKDIEDIKTYQLKNYYNNTWKPEYDEWFKLLAGWIVNSSYNKIAWNSALTYEMIFTQPVVYEFPNVTAPTLLLIGTRDRTAIGKNLVSKEVAETMGRYDQLGKLTHQKIPNSTLVEIENIGHMPHIESFEEFIKPLLTFLAE